MELQDIKAIEYIERKRWELWLIALLLIIIFSITVTILSLDEKKGMLLIFLSVFSILFSSYILEKEKNLKKLFNKLIDQDMQLLEEKIKTATLKEKMERLTALYIAGQALISEKSHPHKALDTILKAALSLFKSNQGSIMLIDKEREVLIIACAYGLKEDIVSHTRQKVGEGIAGHVAKTGEPVLLSGKVKDERFKNFVEKTTDIKSGMCVPLQIKGETVGVLNLSIVSETRFFTEYDIKLLSIFANFASMALENAQVSISSKLKS